MERSESGDRMLKRYLSTRGFALEIRKGRLQRPERHGFVQDPVSAASATRVPKLIQNPKLKSEALPRKPTSTLRSRS